MEKYEKIFAENLKTLRRASNMTQKQLGDILGYSEKAISKWEKAMGVPNIATLYEMAKVFRVTIDGLFSDKKLIYFLGIDGGGEKTELALVDSNNQLIRSLQIEGCNPVDIGIEKCKERLSSGIWQICEGIPFYSISVYVGLAGGKALGAQSAISELLKEFGFFCYYYAGNAMNIIEAGLGKRDGVVVIMETGISACTQYQGRCIKTSGWGYLIDDGGSAYNIGREGLCAYYAAIDHTGNRTLLTELISNYYGESANALLRRIYDGKVKMIANVATLVIRAAEQGDQVSKDIIKRNMNAVKNIVRAASEHLHRENNIPVVIVGELSKERIIQKSLSKILEKEGCYNIKFSQVQPVMGAVKKAQELYKRHTENKTC